MASLSTTRALLKALLLTTMLLSPALAAAPENNQAAGEKAVPEIKSIQVGVVARFITLKPAVLKTPKLKLEELFTVKKTGEKIVGRFMDDQVVNDFILATQACDDCTVMTAPRMNLVNGEKGSTIVAQQQSYISGWTEAKDGEKRKAQISTAQTGVFVYVTPTVSADGKFVTLAMNARVSQLMELKNGIWPKAPQENLKVQEPVMQLSEVNTVISIPDDGTFAMLLERKDDLKEGRDHMLLLLLSPTITGAKAP